MCVCNPGMTVHRHKPALSQGCLHEVILGKKRFVGREEEGALYGSIHAPVEAWPGHLCALQETHRH